ncbi:Store-operated calcium entry-associated regulatory factor [Halocaridina rubra]|uniref:Store-operated calcium entry-associated regulatory factor n=1 Tax=Halocaridina rubra TaxID=373956 RepID=A0AAN8XP27_HALRR
MRENCKMTPAYLCALLVLGPVYVQASYGFNTDSILLKDIEVLTLYSGRMTAGSRSSPVPQIECVKGGTASCDAFRPRVVQCYNRGWDGVDVQWECKSDMDNAYRFGEIEVSCEGYSHRDDPYVLRGSCGLRYSLDYTKEGLHQRQDHSYYGSQDSSYGFSGYSHQTYGSEKLSKASNFADLIVFVAVGVMLYAFYKTCCSSNRRHVGQDAHSNTSDDYPAGGGGGGRGGYGWFGQGGGYNPTAPPPPGYEDGASCRNRTANAGAANAGGGGFWTGAAAGGLLGYMFGNRGNQGYGYQRGYYQPRYAGGTGWFGGGTSGFGGGGNRTHHAPPSTGTRTASGFGGTSRR